MDWFQAVRSQNEFARAGKLTGVTRAGFWGGWLILLHDLCPKTSALKDILTTTDARSIRWLVHGMQEPFGSLERAPMLIQSQSGSRLRSRTYSRSSTIVSPHISITITWQTSKNKNARVQRGVNVMAVTVAKRMCIATRCGKK